MSFVISRLEQVVAEQAIQEVPLTLVSVPRRQHTVGYVVLFEKGPQSFLPSEHL